MSELPVLTLQRSLTDTNVGKATDTTEWLKATIPDEILAPQNQMSWAAMVHLNRSAWLLGAAQIALIILFACCSNTDEVSTESPGSVTQGYNMFIGVAIMMFIGFGYLMTFMKWYGLGAVGFTMMVTAIGLQFAVFTESFFEQIAFETTSWHYVNFDIYSLLDALYAISAVLIAFGAVIGKVSSFQVLIMCLIQLIGHSFNYEVLMIKALNLNDMGGTYSDHMFGAYFGLTVAWMLGKPKNHEPEGGTTSDLFSLLGTLFLWIYWPSFVAGAAVADSSGQGRAIVNTILSLAASTVSCFWLSSVLSKQHRFRPVDIQNATLAGGVSIGCVAQHVSPFGAIMVGTAAGLISAFGFNKIQPYILEHFHVHDTCGIHNLHAMPSVLGGIASVIIAAYNEGKETRYHDMYETELHGQWWRQLAAIPLCIAWAVGYGVFTGYLLRFVAFKEAEEEYRDDSWWDTQMDYGTSIHSEIALGLCSIHSELRKKTDGEFRKEFLNLSQHFVKRANSMKTFGGSGTVHGNGVGVVNGNVIGISSSSGGALAHV